MDAKYVVKNEMGKWGQKVTLKDGDWESMPFKAFIQPLRYKNKMYLKNTNTPIGTANQDYFLLIAPFDHSPVGLSASASVRGNEESFLITKSENVILGDGVLYSWSILRRIWEEA